MLSNIKKIKNETLKNFLTDTLVDKITDRKNHSTFWGEIIRLDKTKPVWCLWVWEQEKNGRKMCNGIYSLNKITDPTDFPMILDVFAFYEIEIFIDSKNFIKKDVD